MRIEFDEFARNTLGRPFDGPLARDTLPQLLTFVSDDDRLRRMEEAEVHHDRPALAGVILELETHPLFRDQFQDMRFRKALGAMVTFVMMSRGWKPVCSACGQAGLGSRHVKSRMGVSKQLRQAARFAPPDTNATLAATWKIAHPTWIVREKAPRLRQIGTDGKTPAQEMADILASMGLSASSFAKKILVSETSVRKWRKQARRDSGETSVEGRSASPTKANLAAARRHLKFHRAAAAPDGTTG